MASEKTGPKPQQAFRKKLLVARDGSGCSEAINPTL